MQSRFRYTALVGAASLLFSSTALAHVSMAGPGFAGQTQVLTFSIGHGCEGADTLRLEVSIPSTVTSVRVLPNVFGDAQLKTDDTGAATAVIWSKPTASVRAQDDAFYQLAIRAKLPDAAFTTVYFPAKQTCRAADGKETVVDWVATAEEVAAAKMGEEPEPAPALSILPVRLPGWNKYTTKAKITDLSVFKDAQIVWVGDAAYSSNPATLELIKSESGVTELTEIKADAEIWVKY
jgi:uncharacterized protein YcnI